MTSAEGAPSLRGPCPLSQCLEPGEVAYRLGAAGLPGFTEGREILAHLRRNLLMGVLLWYRSMTGRGPYLVTEFLQPVGERRSGDISPVDGQSSCTSPSRQRQVKRRPTKPGARASIASGLNALLDGTASLRGERPWRAIKLKM